MSRITELEQRISEMLAADAGGAEVFFQIIDLVKEYEDTFNSAIEIRRDNLAYVIIAVKRFLDILVSIDEDITLAAQCLYRVMATGKVVREEEE